MNKEQFVSSFSDELNCLQDAFLCLEFGMLGGYGAEIKVDFSHSESPGKWAGFVVEARSFLRWGNGWKEYESVGQIHWYTTSGHYVRFDFSREERGEIELKQITIADDPSESFYPWVKSICARNNIPLEVSLEVEHQSE